jgi:hypothetical protein
MVLKQYIFALRGEEKIQLGEWAWYAHLENWMLCRKLTSLSRENLLSLKEEAGDLDKAEDENLRRVILVIKTAEELLDEGYTIEYTSRWE